MHIYTVTSKHAFCELLNLFNATLSITLLIKWRMSGQLVGQKLLEENHKKIFIKITSPQAETQSVAHITLHTNAAIFKGNKCLKCLSWLIVSAQNAMFKGFVDSHGHIPNLHTESE